MTSRPQRGIQTILRRRPRPWLAWGLAIFTTVVLVEAVFGDAGYFARVRAGAKYERHVARLTAIRQDNAELQRRARRLAQDRAAIEAAAREELGLLRRGELLFLITDRHPHP